MRTWLEERYLRIAYWLLARCHHQCHSTTYIERLHAAQHEVAELVCVYYSPRGRAVGNR